MNKEQILLLIVSLAQVIGLIGIVAIPKPEGNVLAGIGGFACIVKYLLPSPISSAYYKKLQSVGAICGIIIIFFAITRL